MVEPASRTQTRSCRKLFVALVLGLGMLTACSAILGIDFPPQRPDEGDGAPAVDGGPSEAAAEVPIAVSCRGIKEKVPTSPSGTYALIGRDGGFYCDMESFDGGGWTLVRADMIREGRTQDADPTSPNTVDIARITDPHGGARWAVNVTGDECNATPRSRAMHWVLVEELDGWTQIMASYRFTEGTGCWAMFGNDDNGSKFLPDMNVRPFDEAIDLIDRQQNMARSTTGQPIQYEGKTGYCGPGRENFWSADYRGVLRTARVVLRRTLQGKPGGLAVATSCGRPAWELYDVFVR